MSILGNDEKKVEMNVPEGLRRGVELYTERGEFRVGLYEKDIWELTMGLKVILEELKRVGASVARSESETKTVRKEVALMASWVCDDGGGMKGNWLGGLLGRGIEAIRKRVASCEERVNLLIKQNDSAKARNGKDGGDVGRSANELTGRVGRLEGEVRELKEILKEAVRLMGEKSKPHLAVDRSEAKTGGKKSEENNAISNLTNPVKAVKVGIESSSSSDEGKWLKCGVGTWRVWLTECEGNDLGRKIDEVTKWRKERGKSEGVKIIIKVRGGVKKGKEEALEKYAEANRMEVIGERSVGWVTKQLERAKSEEEAQKALKESRERFWSEQLAKRSSSEATTMVTKVKVEEEAASAINSENCEASESKAREITESSVGEEQIVNEADQKIGGESKEMEL